MTMKDSIRDIALSAAIVAAGTLPGGAALAAPSQPAQPHNQQQAQSRQKSSVHASQQQKMQQKTRIPLLPAADLVGRAVTDAHGHDAGRVDSMVIDTKNGVVEYLLIGGRGNFNLNGQFVAVPWSVVQAPRGKGAVALTISAKKLKKAPRLTQSALYELGTPAWRSRVYGYYGRPYPYYGSSAWYGPYRPYPYSAAAPGINGTVGRNVNGQSNTQAKTRASATAGMSSNATTGANASNTSKFNQPAAQASNGKRLAISRNGVVSSLMDISNVSPSQLRSDNVVARNGAEMGHVNEVMIDTRSGHVAYVLLKRGGFLGLNPTWYPVPVEALHWQFNPDYRPGNGGAYDPYGYRLVVNEHDLRGIPSVPVNKANLTTFAPRRDLAKLYSHFGVKPFWIGGAQNANQSSTTGQGAQ